jgi:hypothetical protein
MLDISAKLISFGISINRPLRLKLSFISLCTCEKCRIRICSGQLQQLEVGFSFDCVLLISAVAVCCWLELDVAWPHQHGSVLPIVDGSDAKVTRWELVLVGRVGIILSRSSRNSRPVKGSLKANGSLRRMRLPADVGGYIRRRVVWLWNPFTPPTYGAQRQTGKWRSRCSFVESHERPAMWLPAYGTRRRRPIG